MQPCKGVQSWHADRKQCCMIDQLFLHVAHAHAWQSTCGTKVFGGYLIFFLKTN
jgi:hypothetical protein